MIEQSDSSKHKSFDDIADTCIDEHYFYYNLYHNDLLFFFHVLILSALFDDKV